jgi:hypothetical protein
MNWQDIIPGEIAIKFDKPRAVFHYFSLGEIMNGSLFTFSSRTKYTVDVHVVPHPSDHKKGEFGKFSSFYEVGDDWVLYKRKYGGLTCELLIQGLPGNKLTVYVNSFYLNLVKAKIDGLYPVGVHLTDILLYKILDDDNLVVHGASLFDPDNEKSFLLVAPPDTGKTYTTFKLLEKGYKFLGEDLSFYDGQEDALVCMPYTSTWGHRFKFKKIDVSKIPFVGLLSNSAKKGVEEIFGKESVKERAHLDRIYLLEKSDDDESIEQVTADKTLLRKVMAIQRNEFSYFKNPLLRAYEYYHPLGIDEIYTKEAKNFEKLFTKKDLFVVRAPHYERYEHLIVEHMSSSRSGGK